MPRGGARRNSGPAKGTKYKPTLAKEQARELARAMITAELAPLLHAQIANAKGIKYLVVRDKKTGKFIRVTEAMAKARQALKDSEEIIEVWEKDPSVQAFTDLLNRALDKPKEQALDVKVDMADDLLRQLTLGRARNKKLNDENLRPRPAFRDPLVGNEVERADGQRRRGERRLTRDRRWFRGAMI